MSCPSHLPRGSRPFGEEAGQTWVSADHTPWLGLLPHHWEHTFAPSLVLVRELTLIRFMFDRIMPLSEAVEGYALFDQMKVQKVIFTP